LHLEGFSLSRLRIVLLGSGILLLAASGCHRTVPADVVATVNGKPIARAELDKYYENYKGTVGDAPQEPSKEQADIVRLQILRQLIDYEIVEQRAEKLNLAASDEDVNAKLTEWKAPYTQEEFEKQLKQRNLTLDDLKRDIRRSLTRTKLLNKEIESKINITDAEITNYYNSNKSEFNLIEPRYRLAQIVVTGSPPLQGSNLQARRAPNEAEARKEIQAIRNRLEAGDDFAVLASQYSENPNSAPNGGDMGFVTETQLRGELPDVYSAINRLKPGEITESLPIYDTSSPGRKIMGYAIYKLISREAAGQRELNDPRVQQSIRQELRDRKAQLLQTAYFEMLHNQATVRNYFAEQILKTAQ
jgi:peptidyl-prolyl cis-trans isomerase SurA